jgi:hypothetical protein
MPARTSAAASLNTPPRSTGQPAPALEEARSVVRRGNTAFEISHARVEEAQAGGT